MSAGKRENLYSEIEDRLAHLAEPLELPEIGDWLAEHAEEGQTFAEYLADSPVRHDDHLSAIYLCLIGDLTPVQEQLLERTRQYLGLFFDVPVRVHERLPLSRIPRKATRMHGGTEQLLSKYILREVLEPSRPSDALAYLALTACDLWPGKGWNFVFGQANLRNRVGVWSIHRNGDPEEEGQLCLRRTLATATHETGHILTLKHCIAHRCLMNGSNHQDERDSRPMNLCPVCLRKLLWNLQVDAAGYLRKLHAFCRENELAEARWYERAIGALTR